MRIKKIVILIQLLTFSKFDYLLAEDFSKFFVKEREIILKENKQVIVSFPQDIDIDSEGNIWIIDWNTSQLYKFDKNGGFPSLIARKGLGPSELALPQRIYISPNNYVFVVNLLGGRVTKFDSKGRYLDSFIPTDGHIPTTCIAERRDGFILLGGPKQEPKEKYLYGAKMIHLYSPNGKYIKSFCPIDERVGRLGLGRYRGISFALDEQDYIYTVQPVNFLIKVFDKEGNFIRSFGEKQKYYKEPKLLRPEIERDKKKMEEWEKDFTYVMRIFVSDNKVVVLSRNNPSKNTTEYFIDIYEKESGKLIAGGLKSENSLERVKGDKFFFFKAEEKGVGEIENIIEIYRFKGK